MTTGVVVATQEHMDYVAEHMSAVDAAEVMASHGWTPADAVRHSVRGSVEVFAAVKDDVPIAVFGVRLKSFLSTEGHPWMLSTGGLPEHGHRAARASKRVMAYWLKKHTDLYNYVWAENEMAIKWLRWMGFTIHPAQPYGVAGELFHRFDLEPARKEVFIRYALPEDSQHVVDGARRYAYKSGMLDVIGDPQAPVFARSIEHLIGSELVNSLLAYDETGQVLGGIVFILAPYMLNLDKTYFEEVFIWSYPGAPTRAMVQLMGEIRFQLKHVDVYFGHTLTDGPRASERIYRNLGATPRYTTFVGVM
jgi:hypothetical protein